MVHFKHEHFLYMETSQEQNPMVCSTIRKQSETLESLNHCTSVKVRKWFDAVFLQRTTRQLFQWSI